MPIAPLIQLGIALFGSQQKDSSGKSVGKARPSVTKLATHAGFGGAVPWEYLLTQAFDGDLYSIVRLALATATYAAILWGRSRADKPGSVVARVVRRKEIRKRG